MSSFQPPKPRRSKLATAFVIVVSLFPDLGKRLWKAWYNFLARKDRDSDLNFMNYGYDAPAMPLELKTEDEKNRLSINLYEQLIEKVTLTKKDLLEVGSGRGGGLDYLARYKDAKTLTGIDLADEAVTTCQSKYEAETLRFMQGSADALPVETASMDIVINVESSHCYPDFDRFIEEVYRVLKPGGDFCLCDVRPKGQIAAMEESFKQCGFSVVVKREITEQVLSALDKMTDERINITRKIPALLQAAFRDFAGIRSSAVYEMMKEKRLVYMSYQLKK